MEYKLLNRIGIKTAVGSSTKLGSTTPGPGSYNLQRSFDAFSVGNSRIVENDSAHLHLAAQRKSYDRS